MSAKGRGMGDEKQVTDSPTGWVNKHIREYVESNGERGHFQQGAPPSLLLTTTGRKTGVLRRTGLFYADDDGQYIIVASKGGADDPPPWYLNLVANPEVELQVGPDIFPARARVAEGDERARLWKMMCASFPTYESFQSKTTREIPVLVLERM